MAKKICCMLVGDASPHPPSVSAPANPSSRPIDIETDYREKSELFSQTAWYFFAYRDQTNMYTSDTFQFIQ